MRIAVVVGNLISAGCAFVAAFYWYCSARTALPPLVAYFDAAPKTDPFYAALQQGTTFNRTAAAFAAASALSACITALLGIRWTWASTTPASAGDDQHRDG